MDEDENVISYQTKELKRKVNLMTSALTFIMKLSGFNAIHQYFSSGANSMKVVYIFARLFWYIIRNELNKSESNLELAQTTFSTELSAMYSIILPQQFNTIKNIIETSVKKLTKEQYRDMHKHREDKEDEDESERNADAEDNKYLDDIDVDMHHM